MVRCHRRAELLLLLLLPGRARLRCGAAPEGEDGSSWTPSSLQPARVSTAGWQRGLASCRALGTLC